jgi:hypothetical protein
MNRKSVLVFGVALVLLAMIAGAVFADELKGVVWYYDGSETVVENTNDYRVRVHLTSPVLGSYSQGLNPHQTKRFSGERTVIKVTSYNY